MPYFLLSVYPVKEHTCKSLCSGFTSFVPDSIMKNGSRAFKRLS